MSAPRVHTAIDPDRVRQIPRSGFGWIDRRFVSEGHSASLSSEANLLYFFLVAVADQRGLSYWGDRASAERLAMTPGEIERARRELIVRELVLFRAPLYQLLPLPVAPRQRRESPRGGPMVDVGTVADRVLCELLRRAGWERSRTERDPDALG